jgi:hypothetical protein
MHMYVCHSCSLTLTHTHTHTHIHTYTVLTSEQLSRMSDDEILIALPCLRVVAR